MTDRDEGYLQALKDAQETVRQMVSEHGASPESKDGMRRVAAFVDGLIKTKVQRHGDHEAQDAPDPIGGSF